MEYRPLGQTDIKVSTFALGCWPFAGGAVWGDQDDQVSIATVDAALDAGINFFDTAAGYEAGHSERVLGQALEGRRHQAIIATKTAGDTLAPDRLAAACAQSLKNLRTDYIDYYQIHWPNWQVPIEDTAAAFARLKEQGKIRAFGVCNFGPQDLSALLESSSVAANQVPYSLVWRPIENQILPLCRQQNIGLIAYSPLAQGLLTGRYTDADQVPQGLARTRLYAGDRPLAKHGEAGCEAALFAIIKKINTIAAGLGRPMAEVALAWVRQQEGLTSLLVGARNPDELALNLPALDLTLPATCLTQLAETTQALKDHLGTNADPWSAPGRMR